MTTVVSFYTNDWEYPQHAARLAEECNSLQIAHDIKLLPSTNDYHANCRLKASFILDRLQQLKQPVLWIDVDGSLLKLPVELLELSQDYDVGLRPRRVVHSNGYEWHVGTLWFNYTDSALNFLTTYATHGRGTDENKLQQAWTAHRLNLKVYELPETYFVVINNNNRKNLPKDTVIAHRISRSDLKIAAKTQSKKISEGKKQNAK